MVSGLGFRASSAIRNPNFIQETASIRYISGCGSRTYASKTILQDLRTLLLQVRLHKDTQQDTVSDLLGLGG